MRPRYSSHIGGKRWQFPRQSASIAAHEESLGPALRSLWGLFSLQSLFWQSSDWAVGIGVRLQVVAPGTRLDSAPVQCGTERSQYCGGGVV